MEKITREFVKNLLPPRARNAHKGDFGRVLVLAGSTGFSGAAWFCASAAVRSGAGLVCAGLPEPIWNQVASGVRECMCRPLPCDSEGRLDRRSFDWILSETERADVCVCGPGLGRSADLEELVSLLLKAQTPLVLDADGINNKRGHILNCPLVLTPHEGEFRRLAHLPEARRFSPQERLEHGISFTRQNPCVLVLKGQNTLVFAPEREARENTTGGPGLAKGGSGDVLSGVIAALIAQGLEPFDAAAAGVFIHGYAGDICALRLGERGMTPSDVVFALPEAILSISGG